MSNKVLWAEDRKLHDLKWPDENVVKFLYKNKEKVMEGKILDFGCGSGRNTRVMADMGLDIIAMDYNKECLDLTAKKIPQYDKILYICNDETKIPLEDQSINTIIADGALFYLSRKKEMELLSELSRVLKREGIFFADYRSKEDWLYGRGEEIEKDFYKLNCCGSLNGITYAFRDIDEIKEMYKSIGMKIVNYEKIDHWSDNCKRKNSHYIIWGSK